MDASTTLRVYWGPDQDRGCTNLLENVELQPIVSVPLKEVLPLLVDAIQSERTWLRDFQDEEVSISGDLYEMLMAYHHHWKPTA